MDGIAETGGVNDGGGRNKASAGLSSVCIAGRRTDPLLEMAVSPLALAAAATGTGEAHADGGVDGGGVDGGRGGVDDDDDASAVRPMGGVAAADGGEVWCTGASLVTLTATAQLSTLQPGPQLGCLKRTLWYVLKLAHEANAASKSQSDSSTFALPVLRL